MHSFMLPVQLVDKVLDVPVAVLREVLRSMVQKTVVVPQLPSIESRRHSFRAAETDPHGPHHSADHTISPVAVRFRWSMPMLCCCRQQQFAPKAGYAGYDSPRLRSSWLSQAKIFIMAGMDQKDSCSGFYKAGIAGDNGPRAVLSSLVGTPTMLGSMARMARKTASRFFLAVTCARLVLPVTMHLALCSLG